MRSGFSLLEMMLVVVIMGLLASVAAFHFLGQDQQARERLTKVELRSVADVVDSYTISSGRVPDSLDALLTSRPPHLRAKPRDGWERPIVYYPTSKVADRAYTLLSVGADGVEGTDDDIDLWTVEQE